MFGQKETLDPKKIESDKNFWGKKLWVLTKNFGPKKSLVRIEFLV